MTHFARIHHVAGDVAQDILDARVSVGCQGGAPVEVSVRDLLREVPCLLLLATLIGALVFV